MDSAPVPAFHSATDRIFPCQRCGRDLVVEATSAAATLVCQHCGQQTTLPAGQQNPAEKLNDLQRKLRENESQRTEVAGQINQLSIQIHRWKLRLQSLNERKADLEAELAALSR